MESKIERILEDFAEYLAEYHGKNGLGFICTSRMVEEFLNSQSQPEEKGRIGCEYSDCYKCPKCNDELLVTCLHPLELLCTRCREYVELEEIEDTPEEELTDKKKDVDKGVDREDTPEEWEKKISTLVKEGLFEEVTDDKGERVLGYIGCSDKVLKEIKQLLDDREREVLDTVLGELPEGVIKELKLGGHPDPIGRNGFPSNFDGNYQKLYEGIVGRLEEVQTKYANLIYSIKKGIDKLNSKKKC